MVVGDPLVQLHDDPPDLTLGAGPLQGVGKVLDVLAERERAGQDHAAQLLAVDELLDVPVLVVVGTVAGSGLPDPGRLSNSPRSSASRIFWSTRDSKKCAIRGF